MRTVPELKIDLTESNFVQTNQFLKLEDDLLLIYLHLFHEHLL